VGRLGLRVKTVFLDSSVLIAACASKTGASAFVLGLCRQRRLQGLISPLVLTETIKNVSQKLKPIAKIRLIFYLKKANLSQTPSASLEEVINCEAIIEPKDAPILATALKNKVDFLITLDQKHFLLPRIVKFAQPTVITTPGDFVKNWTPGPKQ
jgi:putative PIN family toxin of toxin-antitoxin system